MDIGRRKPSRIPSSVATRRSSRAIRSILDGLRPASLSLARAIPILIAMLQREWRS